MAFDRWAALEEATDHHEHLRTIVLEAERYSLVADDVEGTCSRAVTPFGNHVFFGGWAPYLYKFDKRSGGTGLKISAE